MQSANPHANSLVPELLAWECQCLRNSRFVWWQGSRSFLSKCVPKQELGNEEMQSTRGPPFCSSALPGRALLSSCGPVFSATRLCPIPPKFSSSPPA